MTLLSLPHALERTVVIRARPETVFRYFTDSDRWASWWGAGSTIDPRPGGRVFIRYPNAVESAGEVLEIDPPRRVVFTFGFVSGQPLPVGGSRVTIHLAEDPAGTRLSLRHEFTEREARDQHVQGWRYQLAVFANRVADDALAGVASVVDAWFAAWSEPDAGRRRAHLERAVGRAVRFRDRFSNVDGLDDLEPQLAAVHVFMPGNRLERTAGVRHCQGTVLADWVARGADGAEKGRGTNVFQLDPDGRIVDVVGIWGG